MLLLRASERISILAFGGFVLLGWRHGLDRVRQAKITALGIGAIASMIFGAVLLPEWVSPLAASITRDWIPCLLVLQFYALAGQFVTRVDAQVEMRLERLDQRWAAPVLEWCARQPSGAFVFTCLELAYFSYYISILLAVGALFWCGAQREADFFWTVVLAAAYGSCGMLAFVQTRPPRMIGEKWSAHLPSGKARAFNIWILRHGSVQANTIPSAHVAIATACALALIEIGAVWIGLIFLAVAIGIAFGAVAGRYHYLADAVLGILLAAMALVGGIVLAAWGLTG
jgi:hypothetical protein